MLSTSSEVLCGVVHGSGRDAQIGAFAVLRIGPEHGAAADRPGVVGHGDDLAVGRRDLEPAERPQTGAVAVRFGEPPETPAVPPLRDGDDDDVRPDAKVFGDVVHLVLDRLVHGRESGNEIGSGHVVAVHVEPVPPQRRDVGACSLDIGGRFDHGAEAMRAGRLVRRCPDPSSRPVRGIQQPHLERCRRAPFGGDAVRIEASHPPPVAGTRSQRGAARDPARQLGVESTRSPHDGCLVEGVCAGDFDLVPCVVGVVGVVPGEFGVRFADAEGVEAPRRRQPTGGGAHGISGGCHFYFHSLSCGQ